MQTILQDLSFALRQLRRAPAFALVAIITLALALGITSALVGVLRATLLNALPYPEPSRLVDIADTNLRGFKSNGLVSVLRALDLAEATANGHKLFANLAIFYFDDSSLTLDGHEPIRVPVTAVSGTFFATIAAPPLLGRTLTPADDVPNGPQLLVISHRLWQTAFAADPTIIGRTVHLGPSLATVIGVMPPTFGIPAGQDVWHPGHIFPAMFGNYRGDGSRFVQVVARLDPSQTPASATAQANLLATRLASANPATDAAWGFKLTSLRASLFGEYRQALTLLACAVALVLLVTSINLAGLQLSRNAARAPEFAIRTALGISRPRLIRQLLTEGLLLVALGDLAGLAVGTLSLRLLVARLPPALLQVETPHIDLAVALVSALIAIALGLLIAVLPALQTTRLAASSIRSVIAPTRATTSFGRIFAVLQIALSLILLTLSTAVLHGLYRLINLPLGFEPTAITFTIDLPWAQSQRDTANAHRLYQTAQASLTALPGVTEVAASSALPLSDYSVRETFDLAGQAPTPQHDAVVSQGRTITPNYLQTLRIPLLAGRDLIAHDAEDHSPRVFLINRTFANRYFPGTNPIGRHLTSTSADLHVAPGSSTDRLDAGEIVGIVGDVAGTGGKLAAPIQPELYSIENGGWPHMQFVLRSTLPPSTLEPQIRRLAASLAPAASAGHFTTLARTLDRQLVQPRLNAGLLSAFAALSLVLVIIGIYGLFAFETAQRTREIGLRLALGSTRSGIRNLVLAASTRVLATGLALGILGSLLTQHLLTATLPGVTAADPLLLLATILLLALAVLAASLIPARRAAQLDPMQTLKSA